MTNAQRAIPVPLTRLRRVARRAVRGWGRGRIDITFIDAQRMRVLNRRFLRHDRSTDVLSFRYDAASPLAGEILIAPSEARAYAKRHGLSYLEELSRYVAHGLLHWRGEEDRTPAQQRRMRRLENAVLNNGRPRVTRSGGPHARPQSLRDSRRPRTDVGSRSGRTRGR